MLAAEILLSIIAIYFGCGLLFGLAFVTVGVARIDPSARGTSAAFRLLILPGAVTWWPLMLIRWLRAFRSKGKHV